MWECAHLHAIHLELADDLDSHVALGGVSAVAGAVDVAEGAVTHLLEQFPILQTGIPRELATALVLLGHDLGDVVLVGALLLGTR